MRGQINADVDNVADEIDMMIARCEEIRPVIQVFDEQQVCVDFCIVY